MDFSRPENFSSNQEKAIWKKLVRGREFATQLRAILGNGKPFAGDGSMTTAEDLVVKILGSFTDTISILNRNANEEVSQIPTTMESPSWDGRKSEDSDGSSKTSAFKDRRGCYKRRKTDQTWSKITPTLIEDGHAWRKYGQKVILNTKHPRNYYRCTHRFDQGCQATKQVQRTDDEPPAFRTTYHGHHTCKTLLKPPELILDSTNPGDSLFLLNFGSTNNNNNNNVNSHGQLLPTFPYVKREFKGDDEHKPSLIHNQSSPYDYLVSHDLTAFETSGPSLKMLSSGSDHGDVISCSASTHSHSLDMDMMVGAVDFDAFDFAPY